MKKVLSACQPAMPKSSSHSWCRGSSRPTPCSFCGWTRSWNGCAIMWCRVEHLWTSHMTTSFTPTMATSFSTIDATTSTATSVPSSLLPHACFSIYSWLSIIFSSCSPDAYSSLSYCPSIFSPISCPCRSYQELNFGCSLLSSWNPIRCCYIHTSIPNWDDLYILTNWLLIFMKILVNLTFPIHYCFSFFLWNLFCYFHC